MDDTVGGVFLYYDHVYDEMGSGMWGFMKGVSE